MRKSIQRPKHPSFDKIWKTEHVIVYKLAAYIARKLGGHRDDYLGHLTLRLNNCLYRWQPEKGNLQKFLSGRAIPDIIRSCLNQDRESAKHNINLDKIPAKEKSSSYTTIENRDFWLKIIKPLNFLNKRIILYKYKKGKSFAEIGRLLNYSRAHIQKQHENALKTLKSLNIKKLI